MKLGIDLSNFRLIHAGGKDEVAYNLLRGFAKLGYSKDIVCFCYPELAEKLRGISPDMQILTIPEKHTRWILRYKQRIEDGLNIRKYLKYTKIDALLFTNKESPLVRFPAKTFVITHDIQLFRHKVWDRHLKMSLYRLIDRIMIKSEFRIRDHIFSISDFDKGELCTYMPYIADKVNRRYNPIVFTEQNYQMGVKKYITALNIQWDHKNIETLIRAYGKIANQTSYDLILVGKKPTHFQSLVDLVKECGINKRVIFTGFVSDEELRQIISLTRVYVNPSFFEGFGMTAVEMMGWKIPTIVAKNTAQPEVTQGLCKYYEPTDDPDALANEIMKEINDPFTEEQLTAISEKIRASYDYVHISQEYWTFIEAKCE